MFLTDISQRYNIKGLGKVKYYYSYENPAVYVFGGSWIVHRLDPKIKFLEKKDRRELGSCNFVTIPASPFKMKALFYSKR